MTGIDINDSIIDQYVESYDEYRKNQVGHSGRVYTLNIDDEIAGVYPARVKFRGFSEDSNTQGYKNITNYLKENVNDLYEEINKE